MRTIDKAMCIVVLAMTFGIDGRVAIAAPEACGEAQASKSSVDSCGDNQTTAGSGGGSGKVSPLELPDLSLAMSPALGVSAAQYSFDGIVAGLAKPETAKKLAKFTKNYFDALIAEGFTRDEALQIVKAFTVPSAGGK